MKFKNYTGIIGVLLVVSGALSPMLHVVISNWNYWDIDHVLASIVFILAGTGLLAAIFSKYGLLRFCGWGIIFMLAFTLTAVYFKANDYFSFIPLKKLARALTGIVHYRWTGWGTIAVGALIMVLSGRKDKVKVDPATAPTIDEDGANL